MGGRPENRTGRESQSESNVPESFISVDQRMLKEVKQVTGSPGHSVLEGSMKSGPQGLLGRGCRFGPISLMQRGPSVVISGCGGQSKLGTPMQHPRGI